jgi:putative Mn2+ efflux pump MntP
MNMYLDIAVIIVGVISIIGCWLGWHIGRDLDSYSSISKTVKRGFHN